MLKRILFGCLVAALSANMGHALDHPTTSKIVIPVGPTSPADAKQMFTSYCAPCHGVDGRGHGPAASALRVPPTDLSNLTAKNGGKFPDVSLMAVLHLGVDHATHGGTQMPAWGRIFTQMDHTEMARDQRMTNLVEYLRTLQVR